MKKDDIKLKTSNLGSDANIYIDFALKSDSKCTSKRIQFNVFSQKVFKQTKIKKEFVDVVHIGLEYRISIAFEKKEEISIEDFRRMNITEIDSVRMKNRRSWKFQFMTIDLTTVFKVFSSSKNFPEFFKMVQKYTIAGNLLLLYISL
jgi:hypothetical protein